MSFNDFILKSIPKETSEEVLDFFEIYRADPEEFLYSLGMPKDFGEREFTFNIKGTQTGRFDSSKPNISNKPKAIIADIEF